MSSYSMSKHKDTDKEILRKLDDRSLLKTCMTNKYYWNEVCNEQFFKNIIYERYPGAADFNYNLKGRQTWRQYYLNIVRDVAILRENYNYSYKIGNLKNQVEVFQFADDGGRKDPNDLLIMASKGGEVELIKEAILRGANDQGAIDDSLIFAVVNGHLEAVKYLIESNKVPSSTVNTALFTSVEEKQTEILKYLISKGGDITILDLDDAIESGNLEIVKVLVDNKVPVTKQNIKYAKSLKTTDIEKYLKKISK